MRKPTLNKNLVEDGVEYSRAMETIDRIFYINRELNQVLMFNRKRKLLNNKLATDMFQRALKKKDYNWVAEDLVVSE